MIFINELVAGYGSDVVLKKLNISFAPGQIHGLVGLNGSGKSTLLRCIFGLLKKKGGSILQNDELLNKKFMSFLETEPYFYNGINGLEYLSLFQSEDKSDFDLNAWSDLFQLPLSQLMESYSTGMKKKLALLGVIKSDKPIMLLDEPFNGLDLEMTRVLFKVLERLRDKNKTIIITSHLLETLSGLSNKIYFLKNGVIQKTYENSEFDILRTELYHELDQNIQDNIEKLMSK